MFFDRLFSVKNIVTQMFIFLNVNFLANFKREIVSEKKKKYFYKSTLMLSGNVHIVLIHLNVHSVGLGDL